MTDTNDRKDPSNREKQYDKKQPNQGGQGKQEQGTGQKQRDPFNPERNK